MELHRTYERRKLWLIFGRSLLTIGVLGLLTITVYFATKIVDPNDPTGGLSNKYSGFKNDHVQTIQSITKKESETSSIANQLIESKFNQESVSSQNKLPFNGVLSIINNEPSNGKRSIRSVFMPTLKSISTSNVSPPVINVNSINQLNDITATDYNRNKRNYWNDENKVSDNNGKEEKNHHHILKVKTELLDGEQISKVYDETIDFNEYENKPLHQSLIENKSTTPKINHINNSNKIDLFKSSSSTINDYVNNDNEVKLNLANETLHEDIDIMFADSNVEIDHEHRARHKKDQLIIREDDIYYYQQYRCIPCKVKPGKPYNLDERQFERQRYPNKGTSRYRYRGNECRCNPYGSNNRSCNRQNGYCNCKPNVVGRACDQCTDGFWNINSSQGCTGCQCDALGSRDNRCDTYTGQCNCKTGVGGSKCDQCLENHYGFSAKGCKKCDDCPYSTFICDPESGRCICPKLSKGTDCRQCYPNTWGWEHRKGCKICDCESCGSIGQSCDTYTGQCICREGYNGVRCDSCAPGYYGYPNCQRCDCNLDGSIIAFNNTIICDDRGQCPCKSLTTGLKCDKCRQATFGISKFNPDGCTRCFCFGRTQECEQSQLTWGQIRSHGPRNLSVEYISTTDRYVVVIEVEGSRTFREDTDIENMNGLNLIPSSTANVSVGSVLYFSEPLYFQLPPQFFGDRITSYNGFLQYSVLTENNFTVLHTRILKKYPLVQIHSHNNLILEYFGPELLDFSSNATYSIRLNERNWRYHLNGHNVTRAVMMIALQNIRHIFLRATTYSDFTQVVLSNVSMDTALYLSGAVNHRAIGVEQCHCPIQYNSTSCQNPGQGYYRWKIGETKEEHIEEFIGRVIPCQCNGRSNQCDIETGHCQMCEDHTGGINCEICAEGYYGEPQYNGCQACPCPETNRNYAKGCTVLRHQVNCLCKLGYTGQLCDKCQKGYYGNPEDLDGQCSPCNCNADGVISDNCDILTGQCSCKMGITGKRCDKCEESRHVFQDKHCKMCDNCTLTLLDRTDELAYIFDTGSHHLDTNGIPAPWPRLLNFVNQTESLTEDLIDFLKGKQSITNFNAQRLDKMTSKAMNIKKRWEKLNNRVDKRNHGSEILRSECNGILNTSKRITNDIHSTIDSLNQYGMNDHNVNLQLALKEAKVLLENIKFKSIDDGRKKEISECARTSYNYWANMTDLTNEQHINMIDLKIDAEYINDLITNVSIYGEKSLELSYIAGDQMDVNRVAIDRVISKYDQFGQLKNNITILLSSNQFIQADELRKFVTDNHEKLEQEKTDILELQKFADQMSKEFQRDMNEIETDLLPSARKHSKDLTALARDYAKLFKHTKNGAAVAMLASTAHKNITDAINAAKNMAIEATNSSELVELNLYPKLNKTSIINRAINSVKKSEGIISNAINEMDKLKDLQVDLQNHKNKVNSISNMIWQSGLSNNNISSEIDSINNNETRKIIVESLDSSSKITDQMRKVRKDAIDISNDVYKLKMKLGSLEPEWDSKFGLAEENVSQSFSNIKAANKTLNHIEMLTTKNSDRFEKLNNSIAAELQELRDLIAKARHKAESIRIPIDASKTNKCVRSYVPPLFGLTTSNSIKMSIALNSSQSDTSPLLYIQGEDQKFIALEMVKWKIRFIWNLGSGTGSITHPMEIKASNPRYDDAWYQIEANRTMNIGTLSVKQMGLNGNPIAVNGESNPSHTRFVVLPNDRLWIGGLPQGVQIPDLTSTSGLGVILQQVSIDEKPIGLWHFTHSHGDCQSTIQGPQEASLSINSRYFNGDGYAVVSRTRSKPQKKDDVFSIQMTFKTLDENALLFLAVDDKNNRSVSLTLHQGKIVFRIEYGEDSKLEINTTKRYNTGSWVSVEAARQFTTNRKTENGNLKVNNEEPQIGSPTTPITLDMLPNLSRSQYHLGGVQPGFKSGTTKAPGADHAFLGCMRDIQVDGETYDPLESSNYFGVEPSCKDTITKAGFYGNGGYVELPSHSLRKRSNFGFVFRTQQRECLLMLSAFPPYVPADPDTNNLRGNYSVSLIDGHVHLWMDAGRGRIELVSNVTVNDGEYHVIYLLKTGRKIEMRIDDEYQGSKNFATSPFAVNTPEGRGGLYFGGAPDYADYDHLAPTFEGFIGAIQDIVFNNATISYKEAINFTNVHIGRTGPAMGVQGANHNVLMKTEPIGKSFTATPEGCHRVGAYSYEPNAFKFGDGSHSHSLINIPARRMWQKNFNIRFDFRTFYPSGLLFIAPGTKEKKKHFVSLTLRYGQLHLTVRGRRKEEFRLPHKLNDGKWHHVVMNNVAKKLTIRVEFGSDESASTNIRLPKRLNAANIMFIGGIADDNLTLPGEVVAKLEEFKGCIRRFKVNNATYDLARPGRHSNVGQCFPRVEKGSYFPGDAFAIYKRNFHVGKYLELELEFRTSEMNGVLLSVAESVGFPALSLEMHNGNIVMSCDLGDGNPFRVQSNIAAKFALCDNRWHNISALYDSEQIALKIDSERSAITLAQNHMSGKVHTKSPLYIGGLPEIAPSGTLLSRENFKGCIRNIVIRNEIKDWTDMDGLHNVLLSECLSVD